MANSQKEIIYISVIVGGGIVAYFAYKKMIQAGLILKAGYDKAVDTTANVIADTLGFDEWEKELNKPIDKESPAFKALLVVNSEYKNGGKASKEIWELAYSEYPDYRTLLLAGKKWGYGNVWNYWFKGV